MVTPFCKYWVYMEIKQVINYNNAVVHLLYAMVN